MPVGHLAREPIHPRARGRTKPKRLQHPDGAQAGHPEWAGHRLLPHPTPKPLTGSSQKGCRDLCRYPAAAQQAADLQSGSKRAEKEKESPSRRLSPTGRSPRVGSHPLLCQQQSPSPSRHGDEGGKAQPPTRRRGARRRNSPFPPTSQQQRPAGGARGPSRSRCHPPAGWLDGSSHHPGARRRASLTFSRV